MVALAAFFSSGVLYKWELPMVAQERLSFLYETQLHRCFRLTFIFLFSFIGKIYIMRKVKNQGVPWCKNQSRYHILPPKLCLLFEHVTFTCKPSLFVFMVHTTQTNIVSLFVFFNLPQPAHKCADWSNRCHLMFDIIFFISPLTIYHSL